MIAGVLASRHGTWGTRCPGRPILGGTRYEEMTARQLCAVFAILKSTQANHAVLTEMDRL